MAKLTVQQIAALKPKDKPYKINADTGLQLRVAASGSKVWVVQYVVGGKQREYRLPRPFGLSTNDVQLSLADARLDAAKIRALARSGIDFQIQLVEAAEAAVTREAESAAAQRMASEAAANSNLSVRDMFDAWLLDGVARKDGNAELRRSFAADVLPAIGSIAVRDLTEHDLRGVLRVMVARGVNRAAVMVRNSLTQMFAWAEKRQPWRKLLVDGDPMALIEIEKIVDPDYDMSNLRDRYLSDVEIVELRDIIVRMRSEFDEAPDQRATPRPLDRITECGIWIMLSTLTRVGEMTMATWAHVNLDAGEWFIPKKNVKDNVGDLTVHLSPFAADAFRKLKGLTGHTDWCFPGRGAESHMDVKSIAKQLGDRQSMFKKAKDGTARQPMKNRRHDNTMVLSGGRSGAWTPHDLRRTGATLMQRLKVPLDIVDRCQNHVLAGSKVRRSYLHHDYADETREAWRTLGDHLTSLLGR